MNRYFYKFLMAPVGKLKLVANDRGLSGVLWENDDPKRVRLHLAEEQENHSVLIEAEDQLNAYFSKKLQKFSIPLDFIGTEFQREVWRALLTIPFGETRTYQDIAIQINRPGSVRAVGAANGKNPISIIAPCHRVIGSNGQLTGFAGGLKNKEYLLDLEGNRDFYRQKKPSETQATLF